MKTWLTDRDLQAIITALAMIGAGDWDESSHGPRPDFEGAADRVRATMKMREAARLERQKSLRIERKASRET